MVLKILVQKWCTNENLHCLQALPLLYCKTGLTRLLTDVPHFEGKSKLYILINSVLVLTKGHKIIWVSISRNLLKLLYGYLLGDS